MSKKLNLFDKKQLSIKIRFYLLMDLLVSNQASSRMESVIFFLIFYLQFLTGFFSSTIKVYDPKNSIFDQIIDYIQKIVRLRDLLNDTVLLEVGIMILFLLMVIFSLLFFSIMMKTTKKSFYSYNEAILNFVIKCFVYIFFTMILDISIGVFCLNGHDSDDINNINIGYKVIACILGLYSIFISFFIQQFYNDSLLLSTSYYSKLSCKYEIYITLHSVLYSIFYVLVNHISPEVFMIYNIIISFALAGFYFKNYIFYDKLSNQLFGIFFILYAYTSLFSFIFYYIDMTDKSLIFVISCIIVVYIFFNLREKIEKKLILSTPFNKIDNKYYLLYYFKSLIEKINIIDQSEEERALMIGIIQSHWKECPTEACITKTKRKLYLPMTEQWSDRDKPFIQDRVFLLNFLLSLMVFFVNQSFYCPEIIINLSLFYLQGIGNYCLSMFYYTKVKELKLSLQENFSFIRLNYAIAKKVVEKLKEPNEACLHLEDLNVTHYFKYEDLSQKFYEEINKDVNLSLEFWKCFKRKSNEAIDFNKIFHLTDNIRKTKNKIEHLWHELYKLYNGVNELFELYLNYVENINDDDLQKRDLEAIKRKMENNAENIQLNFYNVLFGKETGIIIASGDKGKEGIIEKTNREIESIFFYRMEELKGMNISYLMPKIFETAHRGFMENFVLVGEKKIIDNKNFKTFAKDKDNTIFIIKKAIKLLPMLNRNIFFVAMITKEKVDDIIFIDSKFNIQGMSAGLMKKLSLTSMDIFKENSIPFYIICKKFVQFYKMFIQVKRKGTRKVTRTNDNDQSASRQNDTYITNDKYSSIKIAIDVQANEEESNPHDNIEINENIELEYEIKIPSFIYEYSKKMQIKSNGNETMTHEENRAKTPYPYDEFNEEEDLLIDTKKNITPGEGGTNHSYYKKSTLKYAASSSYCLIDTPSTPGQNNLIKPTDETKDFKSKIEKHRELFEGGNFNALEDFIDQCNKVRTFEFKFNFTFDKYKFGDKSIAFVIRCVDNKNDACSSSDDSGKCLEENMISMKKEKTEVLKHTIELFHSEKVEVVDLSNNFLNIMLENPDFQNVINLSKKEISKCSRIHGNQKNALIQDEEGGSQTSQTGYNEGLCKKNRVIEIKSNIMKNISNFYTLNYMKILVVILILCSAIFFLVFFICFSEIYSNLNEISNLNIVFYQVADILGDLVSSLLSMRTMFIFKQENMPYEYNSFIEDNNEYFEHMRKIAIEWNNEVEAIYGLLEEKMGKFVDEEQSNFWKAETVTYNYDGINDNEAFPLAISQILANTNNIIRNTDFTSKGGITDTHILSCISYASYMSIENSYNNLFPVFFKKFDTIPALLKEYNNKSINPLLYILGGYGIIVFICVTLYCLLIYLTNKSMEEILVKVTCIQREKIEETINNIEAFGALLSKFVKKDSTIFIEEKNNNYTQDFKKAPQDKNTTDGFDPDTRKHKKLKILSMSYIQIIILIATFILFLVLIYTYTISTITKTNEMITLECYFLGKMLVVSSSMIEIKCIMSQCDVDHSTFKYQSIVNTDTFTDMIKVLRSFDNLYTFYSTNFLLDACLASFIDDKENYDKCLQDPIIKSANNTAALIELIEEKVNSIKKDIELFSQAETTPPYSSFEAFNSETFYEIEKVYYNYLLKVSSNFTVVMKTSLLAYLDNTWTVLIILVFFFSFTIILISLYISFFFIRKLIHLLSVSRCILRIIPTTVITNNNDLEGWLASKY